MNSINLYKFPFRFGFCRLSRKNGYVTGGRNRMFSERKNFSMSLFLLLFAISLLSIAPSQLYAEELPQELLSLVRKAGNADSDVERRDILRSMAERDDLPPVFKRDVGELADFASLWVNPEKEVRNPPDTRKRAAENGYLCYFFKYRDYEDRYIYSKIDHSSPLYPIALMYEARERMWATFQSGNLWNSPDRGKNLGLVLEYFRIAARAFPENDMVAMHLGEPIPWERYPNRWNNAPEWAVLQREGLEKLADIITWWIDERMLENGEFGGGWGDDCEMYRWWVPVLYGFADPKISAAQERFSRALLSQSHHENGYTSKMSDVEHTAEDTGDTITPMMNIDPDNPEWSGRAIKIAELFDTVWSGVNEKGKRQFKSTYFNAGSISDDPYRACDTPRHFAALQPVALYWLRSGDREAGRLILEWLDSWVEATAREGDGKAAGIIPAAVYWPDASFARKDAVWWEPKNNPEPALYRWPVACSWVTDMLLQAWYISGEDRWLGPIRSMASIRGNWLANKAAGEPEPGSLDWCASRMGSTLSGTLAKYRFLSGSDEYDTLLSSDASPYVRYRLNGEMDRLLTALRKNAKAVSVNFEGFTSEVRHTDRVMVWPSRWLVTGGVDPEAASINSRMLYGMATGDVGDHSFFPLNAVRWLTPPREIAAFVRETGQVFSADLFHFGEKERPMAAELYLLPKGEYTWSLSVDGRTIPGMSGVLTINGARTKLPFTLPAGKTVRLEIRPKG